MYFSHIRLKNWKNFKSTDASLSMRTFFVGPNASGKSNLLDVFRFLKDVSESGLRPAVEERGGVSSLRCLAATRYTDINVEVEVQDEGTANSPTTVWTYVLMFNQDNQKRPVIKTEHVLRNGSTILQRPDENDANDPLRLTETALEGTFTNQEFRELADFFRSISYQHLLPQVVRDPQGFSPLPMQNDPYGRDFLMRMWKTQGRTRGSRLTKIAKALRTAVPQLTDLEAVMDESGIPHLVGRYSHWRPHGAKQTEGQFSDGTLRLIGLLWSTFEGNGPLLLEEPEISLHPEVVRRLPTMFYQMNRQRKTARQILVSTHSEEMLSDPGISPEEILRLQPSNDGTLIIPPSEADIHAMQHGLTAADVMIPKTAPDNIEQLTFDW